MGLQSTPDEIAAMQQDSKQKFEEITELDLSMIEEMSKHINPDGTPIEENPSKDTPSDSQPSQTEKPTNDPPVKPSTNKPGSPASSEQGNTDNRDTTNVENILARFYALQSSYISQIESIKSSAYAEYVALPKEARGINDKIRIGRAAVSRATALERECDQSVSVLMAELKAALKAAGYDESVAHAVEQYYTSQKNILKAKYLNKYAKYLS